MKDTNAIELINNIESKVLYAKLIYKINYIKVIKHIAKNKN